MDTVFSFILAPQQWRETVWTLDHSKPSSELERGCWVSEFPPPGFSPASCLLPRPALLTPDQSSPVQSNKARHSKDAVELSVY